MSFLAQRAIVLPVEPTRAALDALHDAGRLPLDVAQGLTLGEAAGLALLLPPPWAERDGMPVGYGVFPPVGAAPTVRTRKRLVDAFGAPAPADTRYLVGCLWRSNRAPDKVVFRLWCRSPDRAGQIAEAWQGPYDTYSDAIASVLTLEGQIPQLTGWQIGRLDAEVSPATLILNGSI